MKKTEENKNRKTPIYDFSFDSALWASIMQIWSLLRGRGSANPSWDRAFNPMCYNGYFLYLYTDTNRG